MNNSELVLNNIGEGISVIIGAGGKRIINSNGTAGGTTTFGTYLSANGGEGGKLNGDGGNGGSGGGGGGIGFQFGGGGARGGKWGGGGGYGGCIYPNNDYTQNWSYLSGLATPYAYAPVNSKNPEYYIKIGAMVEINENSDKTIFYNKYEDQYPIVLGGGEFFNINMGYNNIGIRGGGGYGSYGGTGHSGGGFCANGGNGYEYNSRCISGAGGGGYGGKGGDTYYSPLGENAYTLAKSGCSGGGGFGMIKGYYGDGGNGGRVYLYGQSQVAANANKIQQDATAGGYAAGGGGGAGVYGNYWIMNRNTPLTANGANGGPGICIIQYWVEK